MLFAKTKLDPRITDSVSITDFPFRYVAIYGIDRNDHPSCKIIRYRDGYSVYDYHRAFNSMFFTVIDVVPLIDFEFSDSL